MIIPPTKRSGVNYYMTSHVARHGFLITIVTVLDFY